MSTLDYLLIALAVVVVACLWWLRRRLRASEAQAYQARRERAAALNACASAESALEQERKHLDGIGDAALDALVVLDTSRHIIWGNQTVWETFGAASRPSASPSLGWSTTSS